MERERYDGAMCSLLIKCGRTAALASPGKPLRPHWQVLLSHLILFGYIYPSESNESTGSYRRITPSLSR